MHIERTIYLEVPPHVEYSLMKKASSLIPLLERIYDWRLTHMDKNHFKCVLCHDEGLRNWRKNAKQHI
ncbi:winged helix-turn-helix transcriptional regulator [Bacillus sp. JJ864]|uniref:winged helix-turn-helix transcriptional regulator n=1 Tax=Bacillus sp. JJ864 TaxID=3122975 RepID=UPI002FFF23B9